MNTDILSRSRVKLAAIMKDIMPYEDWITGSLQEQQNYARSIPEGDIQIIGEKGQMTPFAHGQEHDVFRAIANPASNQNISDIVIKDIPNIVMKSHRGGAEGKFKNDMHFQGDQTMYAKDLLNNPANRDIFPWHDFKMGGNGNLVSEWVTDMNNLKDPRQKADMLRKLKENILKGQGNPRDFSYQWKNLIFRKLLKSELPLPIRQGKSGITYNITDILGNPQGTNQNIGYDLHNNPKILDFLAFPRDPGFLFKAKKLPGLK